jgi:hypothetical protein
MVPPGRVTSTPAFDQVVTTSTPMARNMPSPTQNPPGTFAPIHQLAPPPLPRNGATARTKIHADGRFNDQTKEGGWAAVVARARPPDGRPEHRAARWSRGRWVEAVKLAEGPCTVISDHEGLIGIARQGRTRYCQPVRRELYAAAAGKDVTFEWRRRDQSLGSRLAHQLARDAAKGGSDGIDLIALAQKVREVL